MTDTAATRPYGVLGRVLGHSYTPTIYKELAGLEYVRFEREPEDLEAFMTGDEWEGTNVTIPYKRAVMEYLDELSPLAERMGNVNTITRLPDGRLHGDNTDYFGFQCLVEELGVEVAGKKALVLGATGGAGTTASMVLGDMGAIVVPVGRTSEVNYDNIAQQSDASLLVNCTPAGMFPHCPDAPCTLEGLDALEGVIDSLNYYDEGDTLPLGSLTISVLYTPGHTAGSVTLKVGDALFVGDTLFAGSCGRTDLPGGDPMEMLASLRRLGRLEGDYTVYPGHMDSTTLAREKQYNPFIRQALR